VKVVKKSKRLEEKSEVILIARNINEQKQKERKLLESEQRLKYAQVIARIGDWEWDLMKDKLTWSDQHFRNLGLEPGEIEPSYEKFLQYVHPHDRESIKDKVEKALTHKIPDYESEFRAVTSDNVIKYIRAKGIYFR